MKYNRSINNLLVTCWTQMTVLMLGQRSYRESLKALFLQFLRIRLKLIISDSANITKSNLAKSNTNRDYHIFDKSVYRVVAEVQKCWARRY